MALDKTAPSTLIRVSEHHQLLDKTVPSTLIRVTKHQDLIQALEDGLTDIYQKIFSEPPYYELFSNTEVQYIFTKYFYEGVLVLKYLHREVVGFGAMLPFAKSPLCDAEVVNYDGKPMIFSKQLLEEKYGFHADRTWYISDLGVKRGFRGEGFGKELLDMLIKTLPPTTAVLLRTSKANQSGQKYYRSTFGFDLMNITTDVSHLRQNGAIQTDSRVIMAKVVE